MNEIKMNNKEQEFYDLYKAGALALKKNNFEINSCRCSNNLAQLLLDVDKGIYGHNYAGCLQNDKALKEFAMYMANRK